MAAGRVRGGYSWVLGLAVSGSGLIFRPWFSGLDTRNLSGSVSGFSFDFSPTVFGFGYPKLIGFGFGFQFSPADTQWISEI
jgi:hypothetical protein